MSQENVINQANIEVLMDRWMNDPAFRANLRANPEQAVKGAGMTLNADEMAALSNVDWNLSDDEFFQRVSKTNLAGAGPD